MAWKDKKQGNISGPIKVDRALYRIVGGGWSLLPASDHWVRFMAVVRQHEDNQDVYDVRIFDQWCTDQKGIKVVDYASLDFHPDLVVFKGWYDRKVGNGSIELNEMQMEKVA